MLWHERSFAPGRGVLGDPPGVGYKLTHGRLLANFVAYLEAVGSETVTAVHAVAWAKQPKAASPVRWSARLTVVRGLRHVPPSYRRFARDPAAGLLPDGNHRAVTPHLLPRSTSSGCCRRPGSFTTRYEAATYQTVVGLMAVTGMRVGEVVGLDRDDVDWDQALVTIRKAKFGKSRQVPLHPSTIDALRAYALRRDRLSPGPSGQASSSP